MMRGRTFVALRTGDLYRYPPTVDLAPDVGSDPPDPIVPTDRLTAPASDDLLPQILLTAPRGQAWQSDALMPPLGATVQHRVWGVIADSMAILYGRLTRATLAAFPSVADESIVVDWEAEYGLPDPCLGDAPSLAARRQAIRNAITLPDTNSRQDLIRLLEANGYSVQIEEAEGFECGFTGCGEEGFGHPDLPHLFFVHALDLQITWFAAGETGAGEDGFGSYEGDGLICLIERAKQAHTRAVYFIDGVVL